MPSRNPARPVSDGPSYTPDGLPAYRGGSSGEAPTPPIACAYPFDASEAAVQGYGYTGRLTLSNSDQTGSRVLTAGGGVYAMVSSTLATIGADAGNKCVQLNVDTFDAITGTGSTNLELILYSAGFAPIYGISVIASSTGYQIVTTGYSGPVVGTKPAELGVTFDAADSLIHLRSDGVLLESFAYTPQSLIPIINVTQNSVHADDAGNVVTGTFITSASSITQAEGVATDICGNAI